MRSSNQKVEHGFTIGSVILVCALVAVIYISARLVSKMNSDNKEQAGNLQAAFNGEEQPLTEDEKRDESVKDATVEEQSAYEEKIRKVNIDVDSLSVTIKISLPGTYTGTCYADVELPDGSKHTRFVELFEKSAECTITIPNSRLSGGKVWDFQAGFYTEDGKFSGTHPKSSFSL